jgi:hypothetical protein
MKVRQTHASRSKAVFLDFFFFFKPEKSSNGLSVVDVLLFIMVVQQLRIWDGMGMTGRQDGVRKA